MNQTLEELNRFIGGVGSLAGDFAAQVGVSSSTLDILYLLYMEEGSCLQSHFYKRTGASRSTINSSIKKMEKEGLLYLQDGNGRNKIVVLTESGIDLMNKTAGKWVQLEKSVWSSWSEQDRSDFLRLSKDYYESLKKEIEGLKENE